MALGPGKYDSLTTSIREMTGAQGVVLIVMGGHKGHGFSVQASPQMTARLPALLRTMADQIEQDMKFEDLT